MAIEWKPFGPEIPIQKKLKGMKKSHFISWADFRRSLGAVHTSLKDILVLLNEKFPVIGLRKWHVRLWDLSSMEKLQHCADDTSSNSDIRVSKFLTLEGFYRHVKNLFFCKYYIILHIFIILITCRAKLFSWDGHLYR